MGEMLDKSHLFSRERAIRGAKVNTLTNAAMLTVGMSAVTASNAEIATKFFNEISENPGIGAEALLIYFASHAAVGAVIDGFRPTSKLASRFISKQVQMVKDLKSAAIAAKNGLSSLLGTLSESDYKKLSFKDIKLGYDIIRPVVPEYLIADKKRFITRSTLGAMGASTFWTGFNLVEEKVRRMSDLTSSTSSLDLPLITLVATHPLETIVAGALIGFGVSSYASLFHRPINPRSNQ